MPNTSNTGENQAKTSDNKVLLVAILIFIVVVLVFLWLKRGTKVGEERIVSEKTPEVVVKGREPERINRNEESIKTEAQMREDEITIINAEGAKIKMGLDTSTKYRLAFLNFMKKSLRDFGYTMTINNFASVTDQFKPIVGQENKFFQADCGQYRFEVNPTTKKINIYYYVSNSICSDVFIMKPVQLAFMEMGGGFEFWSSGVKAIFEPEGLSLQADDSPFVAVSP